jgi:hypothetical protein
MGEQVVGLAAVDKHAFQTKAQTVEGIALCQCCKGFVLRINALIHGQ